MDNEKKRITITVPSEMEAEFEALKEEKFKGKSNSEMFRCLMKEGLSVSVSREQKIESGNFK